MTGDTGKNYYINRKSKLIKGFDKVLKQVKIVLRGYFGKSPTDQIVAKSRYEYESIIPDLPYIGGRKNSSTFNLIGGAQILAIIRPLEEKGLEIRQIGKIVYEIFEEYFESKPRIIRWLAGKFMTSRLAVTKMRKKAVESQPRQYSGNWVSEFVEGDGKSFDFGLNVIECGICKFYKERGAEKYIPYLCLGDYPMFRSFGIGLIRTQTIGNGASLCNFRFKKGGKTPQGWPPENLEEFNREG